MAQLKDRSGTTVFEGTGEGFGSGATLQAADFLFAEQPAPGTYSASLSLPAGTLVLDVLVYGLAGWDSSDPLLTIGDSANGPVAYFNGLDLAVLGVYDPATPPDSGGGGAISLGGGGGGVSVNAYAQPTSLSVLPGVGIYYATDDALTLTVVSTSPVLGADGRALVRVLYFPPVAPVAPTFAP